MMASGEFALRSTQSLSTPVVVETRLIDECRAGDAAAFAQLVALHARMVFGLAVRLLGDTEEARDVAQDVFLQVFRTLSRFEGRSSLRTWIFRIVVNQCRNRQRFWRRRRRDRSLAIEDLSPCEEAQLAASRPEVRNPYQEAEREERARHVQSALQRISFEHRTVLLLREVEDLSCAEIGEALGIPEGTVKSRLARARDALRAVVQTLMVCP